MTIPQSLTPHQQLYDTDFALWIDMAAELLKQRQFDQLDLENLIEEVESLGRCEKAEIREMLRGLLVRLLKWQYHPSLRSGLERGAIREHRLQMQDLFDDSPSLRIFYTDILAKSYADARAIAAAKTELPREAYPALCPYTTTQIMDTDFLPDE